MHELGQVLVKISIPMVQSPFGWHTEPTPFQASHEILDNVSRTTLKNIVL